MRLSPLVATSAGQTMSNEYILLQFLYLCSNCLLWKRLGGRRLLILCFSTNAGRERPQLDCGRSELNNKYFFLSINQALEIFKSLKKSFDSAIGKNNATVKTNYRKYINLFVIEAINQLF